MEGAGSGGDHRGSEAGPLPCSPPCPGPATLRHQDVRQVGTPATHQSGWRCPNYLLSPKVWTYSLLYQ